MVKRKRTKGTNNDLEEEFEDIKGVIRIRISKDRQHNGRKKRSKSQTTIYKTLYIKLMIE